MHSIRIYLLAGYLGTLALLVLTWVIATAGTTMLRANYAYTVRTTDALSGVVLETSKLRDDEETGLRGYLLTGRPSFLAPYAAAQRELPAILQQVNTLAVGQPAIRPSLLARRAAGDRWDRWARQVLRQPAPYSPRSAALVAQQEEGKALFDHYRAVTAQVIRRLDQERRGDFATGLDTLTRMTAVFAAIFAAAVALLLGLGWWTTRAVIGPLTRLVHAAAAIERGDLGQPVVVTGPREFVALAKRMDRMRLHLREIIQTLHERERHFRSLVEKAPIGACITDEHGCFETVNEAYCGLHGYTHEELIGQPFTVILPEPLRVEAARNYARGLDAGADTVGEHTVLTKAGLPVTILASTVTLHGQTGRPARASFVVDISERKQMELRLARLAHHDPLTGLPNRALFGDRLAQELRAIDRDQSTLALLLLDLNRFKEVNDTLGHDAGDALLCVVGARLQGVLRASDTVARLGGDEFAVLLPATDEDGAIDVTHKLLAALAEPIVVDGHRLDLGASAGIAVAPAHGADSVTLLRHADVAMYVAKRGGDGYTVYASNQDAHTPARLALGGELRQAITASQLRLHYQPIVDMASGRPAGVEALVRWAHPRHGLLPPDQFIPLAEQAGLIGPLTDWVLEEALRQCLAWEEAGLRVDVAVNLSAHSLHDTSLPDRVAALLTRYALPPKRVTLEITESSVMARPDRAMAVLARLRAIGVRLAIDDFGTGYSSLSLLRRLPVDEVKIDKSFVQGLDSDDASIVSFILGLGHLLNRRVVVEGVENHGVWDLLAALGCDAAQGYFISRPLPAADLERWLRPLTVTPGTARAAAS